MTNYYRYLDLPNGASIDAVKKKYRQLSLEFHPDRNKGNAGAEARFKEISEAYTFLKNTNNKARLDLYLRFGRQNPQSSYSSASSNTYQGTRSEYSSASSQEGYNGQESNSGQSKGGYREVEDPWDFSELKLKLRNLLRSNSAWLQLSLFCGIAVIIVQIRKNNTSPVINYDKNNITFVKIDSLGRVDTIN